MLKPKTAAYANLRIDLIQSPVLGLRTHGHLGTEWREPRGSWRNNEVSRFATQRTRLNANIRFDKPAA
jgi:hypothetical protein